MARHGRAGPAGAADEPGGARGHPPERARVRRALASQLRRAAMIHQLRIYEIFEHNREAFHARFRDHAARLMRHHGFRILDMWESTSDRRLEFVYLLSGRTRRRGIPRGERSWATRSGVRSSARPPHTMATWSGDRGPDPPPYAVSPTEP